MFVAFSALLPLLSSPWNSQEHFQISEPPWKPSHSFWSELPVGTVALLSWQVLPVLLRRSLLFGGTDSEQLLKTHCGHIMQGEFSFMWDSQENRQWNKRCWCFCELKATCVFPRQKRKGIVETRSTFKNNEGVFFFGRFSRAQADFFRWMEWLFSGEEF